MIVKNQLVPVKIAGKNIKHYKDLQYDIKYGDIINVPVEHLTKGCHSKIKLICDNCKKEFSRGYKTVLLCRKRHPDIDFCEYCSKTVLNNVAKLMDNPLYKKKKEETNLKKYGYKNPSSSPIIREKVRQTSIERFGDSSVLGKNSIKRNDINIKIRNRTDEEWDIIKEKANQTLYKNNNTIKSSKQQLEVYSIIKEKYNNAKFNYPVGPFFLDIYLEENDIKLDIEYDGWYWHQDKQKDLRRDMILQKKYNIKILRIKSGMLIPDKEELYDNIDYLLNTNHRHRFIILNDWKEVAI